MLKIYLIWFITIIQLFSEPSTAEQKINWLGRYDHGSK